MPVNHRSGRVVIELEPELKHALHAALARDGLSLKKWFEARAEEFIAEQRQPNLFGAQRTGRNAGVENHETEASHAEE